MTKTFKTPNFHAKTSLILNHAQGGRIGVRKFDSALPHLATQIRRDRSSSCLDLWGRSFNHDEHENAQIVDPKILTVIGKLADYPIRESNTYHAGLIHTYGYLLSNLKTRFGYKRERWANGLIEEAFRIPTGTLLGQHDESTLLQNVSFLMTRIAIANENATARLSQLTAVSDFVREIAFKKLTVTRLEEKVELRSNSRPIQLFTDLIRFRKPSPVDGLLVYSYRHRNQSKIVTCFSIDNAMRQTLISNGKDSSTPIRARFNLAIPSFPIDGVTGKKRITTRTLD